MTIPASANPLLLLKAGGGYAIKRSVRFNSADSAYLSKSFASAGNRKTWTWAGWVKLAAIADQYGCFLDAGITSGVNNNFRIHPTGVISFRQYNGSTQLVELVTTQLFRDYSAWYHLVLVYDSSNATSSDRVRLYVNGERITAFATATYPPYFLNSYVNSTYEHRIGTSVPSSSTRHFDGYLADIHFIDDQALDPTSFGEFDDNGIWQPIAYSGSYGTNGFHLDFADNSTAAALGTDTSSNGNTWTVNNISVAAGAGNDSLVDVPTNGIASSGGDAGGMTRGNYCTWNPLINGDSAVNGSLDVTNDTARGTHKLLDYDAYWEITSTGGTTTAGVVSAGGTTNTTTVANGKTYGFKLSTTGSLDYINITDGGSFTNITTGLTGVQFPYASAASATTGSLNAGQRPFAATAPAGFKGICTANLPEGAIATSGTFTGNANADGPFVYLNGIPTAMTINGNAVTFATHADKLSNGFKLRTSSTSYNSSGSNTYSITTTGDKFKFARAQLNP